MMPQQREIFETADRCGWTDSRTLTGAITYWRVSKQRIDYRGPRMLVWYDHRGQVVAASFTPAKGMPDLPVRGGKSAITSLLVEYGT